AGIPSTPANLAWMDTALELLAGTALDELESIAVLLLMTGHARWQAIVDHGYRDRARESGLTPEELDRQLASLIEQLVTAEQFPHLRRAIDAGVFTADDDPLAFGLERLLDGVALYVTARADGGPSTMPEQPDEPPETDAYPKDAKV